MYRLTFTDGKYIIIGDNRDTTRVPAGTGNYAFPNYIIRKGDSYTLTKTDRKGNVWTFHSGTDDAYIRIQTKSSDDTIHLTQNDSIMYLTYNDDNHTLYFNMTRPNAVDNQPVIIHEPNYYIRALLYNNTLGGSAVFSTVGDMVVKGDEYMLKDHPGYYNICNVIPHPSGQPMSSFDCLVGFNEYADKPVVKDMIYAAAGSTYTVSIDLGDAVDEGGPDAFNPYIGGGDDTDPYNQGGGDSGSDDPDFDDGGSDPVGVPSLPNISATDTGFVTLFNPSTSQLKSLANYMWSGLDLNTFKKLFADPMDAILGLSILPVSIPNGGSRTVAIGNISTGVSMTVAAQQFIEVNCGSVDLKKQSPGSYLDYAPYTKVNIYLPFIGAHPLNTDEVMGKTIGVKYHVDILSGGCTAFVTVDGKVLYQFIGSCAISIPINGNDWTNAINGVLSAAGAIGTMVATGGATAPLALGAVASTATNSMKPEVEKSGGMSGAGGLMGVKKPYLIIQRPRRHVPENQNKFIGYPSFNNVNLGNLNGYNVIEEVHLEDIHATGDELREIERLLKQGVIL